MNQIQLVTNLLTQRTAWLQKLLDQDGRRNIDQECGHPLSISIEEYKDRFDRGDIAVRVVSVYPEETWSTEPDIYETEELEDTEFEKAYLALKDSSSLLTHLETVDVLSGIGRFGVLLLGFDDGQELKMPVSGIDAKGQMVKDGQKKDAKLIYLRSFDESLVMVKKLEQNRSNPRFGQPVSYDIKFADPNSLDGSVSETISTQEVHWSRVIHVADNRTSSIIYGTPRMQRVYNRLLDLRKIAGGSGEMYWHGAFPGLSLETQPTADGVVPQIDEEGTREQMEAYQQSLQRYIATSGMVVKSLNTQVADPNPHLDAQTRLIAIAMAVPWRILVGSEAAQLASEQDSKSWNRRIAARRHRYVNPYLIRPLIDRLIYTGVLPMPAEPYKIKWNDLNTPSDIDRANVAEKKTNAMVKYVQGGGDALIPPKIFLTDFLEIPATRADVILEEVGEYLERVENPTGAPEPKAPTSPRPSVPAR